MVEIAKEVKCPRCGTTAGAGNFCTACGHKLVQECDYWVLRKKMDCGREKCPAYNLLRNRPN